MFLVRSVDSVWWRTGTGHEIPADQVTQKKKAKRQLETSGNTLSFWRSADVDPGGELAGIALAIASVRDVPDGLDLAWVEREALLADGIRLRESRGATNVADLADRHEDAVELDLVRLGVVATVLAKAVRTDGHLRQFTQREILDLLAAAVGDRRLRLDGLRSKLKDAVRARLERG